MGLFSRFEHKAEDVIEGGAGRSGGGIEPVKLCKRAHKEMQREKMVGVGHEYAPTLYNVLVSPEDDAKMSGYYPSLAGEVETYLTGKAKSSNLVLDCPPLVRFIVDDGLKRGRFDVIAESVSPAIIADLRDEEMEHYGLKRPAPAYAQPAAGRGYDAFGERDDAFAPRAQPAAQAQDGPRGYDNLQARAYQPEPAYDPEPAPAYDAQEAAWPDEYAYEGAPERPAQPAERAERVYPPTEPPEPQPQPHVPPQPQPQPQPQPHAYAPPANDPAFTPRSAYDAPADAAATTLIDSATIPAGTRSALFDFATGVRHPLVGARVVVGRGSSCDVIVSEPSVSRHHAEILHDEAGWLIRDTGSTNGTRVNGSRASQSRIYNGDIITLGSAELEFQEG